MSENKKPNLVVVKNDNKEVNKEKNKKVKKKPVKKQSVKNKPKKKQAEKPNKNRKRIDIKKIVFAIIALIILTALCYVVLSGKKISLINDDSNLFSTEFGVNSKADFYVLNKNIFYCTKDTATLLDKKGQPLWSDTFSMVSPSMIGDGKYIGLADIKNKVLNVYNEGGKVYSLETDGNITAFAINPMGASAAVCRESNGNDYTVSVYNPKGEKMFMGTYISSDGIPMTIDISNDGTKVAVGFLNVSGINISSKILFYSTDKAVAQKIENSDAMFAAVNCDKEMAGTIKFLDDDSCIIATDKSLINIGGKDVSVYEQNWKTEFTNYVTALDVIDSDYVAVAYGDKLEETDEDINKNSIYWYNTDNGKVKGSAELSNSVSKLTSGLGITLAQLEDNSYIALKPNGKELWKYSGIQNIENILFYDDTDTIAVVSAAKMTLTDVKNGAENTEVESKESETKGVSKTETKESTTQATTKAENNKE